MQNCLYYTAHDIQELLGVSRAKAYRIVKELNAELLEKGYIVIQGRISKKYFSEKVYGIFEGLV